MGEKNCSTCVHEKGNKCKILKEKISYGCFAWADEVEAARREQAIEKYSGAYGQEVPEKRLPKEQIERRQKSRKINYELRDGKTIKEILDEHFNWWYQQGFTDVKIAEKLYVDVRYVNEYRRDKKLPAWNKKDRPTAMETAPA